MIPALAEAARRWRLPLICGVWFLTLGGLALDGGYTTFLAASFLPILILAMIALLAMAVLALARPTPPRFGIREAAATIVLLLPLVAIHHSRQATLGADDFNTRYVGGHRAGSAWGMGGFGTGSGREPGETSLLDLFLEPERYAGRQVTTLGMVVTDNPQAESLFGRPTPLAFRFVINCCAADAVPLALVLDGAETGSLANNDWARVTGIFRIRSVAGQDLLVLEQPRVTPVQPPPEPYLYMEWGVF